MTYTIPPGSPKAAKAAAFGRELVKACHARDVPLKELERHTGVGHTALDNYRRGLILPRTAVALALAEALDWPRLRTMIEAYRTLTCARPGCGRLFRNDGGNRKSYCSEMCRRIAENVRQAAHRARQAGQTDSGRQRAQQVQLLKAAVRIADERVAMLDQAIDAMCHDCEPEGACRVEACALRPFSPLPLQTHDVRSQPRTRVEVRAALNAKAAPKRSAAMKRRWSDPEWAERQRAATAAGVARMTPESIAATGRAIAAAKKGRHEALPWSDERRANHRAGVRAAAERRRTSAPDEVPA